MATTPSHARPERPRRSLAGPLLAVAACALGLLALQAWALDELLGVVLASFGGSRGGVGVAGLEVDDVASWSQFAGVAALATVGLATFLLALLRLFAQGAARREAFPSPQGATGPRRRQRPGALTRRVFHLAR